MSLLNFGLQGVGIMREKTDSFEDILKNVSNLKGIRSLAQDNPGLENEVLNAVQVTKSLLEHVFVSLKLNDEHVKTFQPCSSADKHMLDYSEKNLTPQYQVLG